MRRRRVAANIMRPPRVARTMAEKTRLLWLTVLILLAAVGGVLGYRLLPLPQPVAQEQAAPDPDCDLRQGACTSLLPSGASILFSLEPRSIPVLQPLQLHVQLQGLDAHRVEVAFSGVDMEMGYNRARLERVAPGSYAGQGVLPVCVRARMEWEARVMVDTGGGWLVAAYRFVTVRPGADYEESQ